MAEAQPNPQANFSAQPSGGIRFRDLEEKQRILKDRILLIGKNLVEIREKNNQEILEIKKDIEIMKQDVKKMVGFLESASAEFSRFARKDELQILSKQAKMFQPLNFVTKQELNKILKQK
jgi:hypothetical protein